MKHLIGIILWFVTVSGLAGAEPDTVSAAPASAPAPGKTIYVIPVREDVSAALVYLVRRGVKEAIDANADAIILDLDTNGGRVDCTEQIIAILNNFPHQDQLYAYVNTKAFSAGAFIASATREIYMAPGSVIGAAAPIMLVPGGGAQEMPRTVEEKMTSAARALVRATAQRQGHNAAVFDAMVDKDQGLTVNGEEIVPAGKILTLTNLEAETPYGAPPRNLLSAGTKANLDAVIATIESGNARVVNVEPTGFEQLARLIVLCSPLLLAGALLCGYIEFKTPGFGVFGIAALTLAAVYFFGHYVAGLSGYENAVIFIVGVALIVTELFILPGHVLPGVLGAGLALYALLRAMVDQYPTDAVLPTLPQLELPLYKMGVALVIGAAGIIALAGIFPKTPLYGALVLTKVNPRRPAGADGQPAECVNVSVGARGRALTMLRPAGTADFGDGPVDVLTQGDFIQAGVSVSVVRIEGPTVIVEAAV
ncbi:MAG: serine protease [Verrucomicrobiales bacterium]|jgi:membrane-bound serine protease (ClpP class)|nr:serine protease [Verrucomicrobiales bacterium]